ncbi:hypothetical protein [Prevotella falsenii]|uniref:hypothetical protein n=1 Tax=Prevotella falsenii TaxID=515414 RepID=UPI0012EB6B55|nr:hypothetical protein [Prevotella falsenii]
MKKLLFLTVAVVLGMSAHAQTREFKQVLSTAGNAQSFTSYKAQLPKKIDLLPIRLGGDMVRKPTSVLHSAHKEPKLTMLLSSLPPAIVLLWERPSRQFASISAIK